MKNISYIYLIYSAQLSTVRAVFEWLLPPCLKMTTRELVMFVPVSMMHLARQAMTLYKVIITVMFVSLKMN